jgi:streptogramin lyase
MKSLPLIALVLSLWASASLTAHAEDRPWVCTATALKGVQTNFPITQAPDGAIWYGDVTGNRLMRLATDRQLSAVVPVDAATQRLSGLAVEPSQQRLWYLKDTSRRLGFVPLNGGQGQEFAYEAKHGLPRSLRLGVDGALWFVEPTQSEVIRMAPDGAMERFALPEMLSRRASPQELATGADGSVWVSSIAHNAVYRRAPGAGAFQRIDLPSPSSHPQALAVGPDGRAWVALTATKALGLVTPDGRVQERELGDRPTDVALDPKGNAYVSLSDRQAVLRFPVQGAVQRLICGANPGRLVVASNGHVWAMGNTRLFELQPQPRPTAPAPVATSEVQAPAVPVKPMATLPLSELMQRLDGRGPPLPARLILHITSFDPGCGHCVNQNPVLDRWASQGEPDVTFLRTSIDPWQNKAMWDQLTRLGIRGIPETRLIVNGKTERRAKGDMPYEQVRSTLLE